MQMYDNVAQAHDKELANQIFADKALRKLKEDEGNYEFLLAVDNFGCSMMLNCTT